MRGNAFNFVRISSVCNETLFFEIDFTRLTEMLKISYRILKIFKDLTQFSTKLQMKLKLNMAKCF